jgi:hypothetical protein
MIIYLLSHDTDARLIRAIRLVRVSNIFFSEFKSAATSTGVAFLRAFRITEFWSWAWRRPIVFCRGSEQAIYRFTATYATAHAS